MRELPLNGRDFEQLICWPLVWRLTPKWQQRAHFGGQCLLHLGHQAGRILQHAGCEDVLKLVATQRRRERHRNIPRYR